MRLREGCVMPRYYFKWKLCYANIVLYVKAVLCQDSTLCALEKAVLCQDSTLCALEKAVLWALLYAYYDVCWQYAIEDNWRAGLFAFPVENRKCS